MRWLSRRTSANWFRWAIRKAWFWGIILLYGTLFGLAAVSLATSDGPPELLETVSFGDGQLIVVLLGTFALAGIMLGGILRLVTSSVAEVVFPAPLLRSSILQARVRKWLIRTLILCALLSVLTGLWASQLFIVPWWLESVRVFLVLVPLAGASWLLGLLASYGFSFLRERTQVAVILAGIAAFLMSLPSLVFGDGSALDDPVVVLASELSTPAAKLLLGFPLQLADLLGLGAGWFVFAALVVVAHEWPYTFFEDLGGTHNRPRDALSREQASASALLHRIALRLRRPYRDVGQGSWALVGKNFTAMGRIPYVLGPLAFLGAALLLALPLIAPGSNRDTESGFIVAFGALLGVMCQAVVLAPSGDPAQTEQIRLLPLTPWRFVAAQASSGGILGLAWAALTAGLAAAADASWSTFGVAFVVVLSVGAVAVSWAVLSGTIPVRAPLLDTTGAASTGAVSAARGFAIVLPLVFWVLPLGVLWGAPAFAGAVATGIAVNIIVSGLFLALAAFRYRRPPKR